MMNNNVNSCNCRLALLALVALSVSVQLASAAYSGPAVYPQSYVKKPGRALDDYVAKVDKTFHWVDTGEVINGTWIKDFQIFNWQGYVLNVTSQTWLTEAETNHPVWSHQLVVIVPEVVEHTNMGAIYATGGHNKPGIPSNKSEDVLVAAILGCMTQSIVGTLFQIPNEPIVFAADPEQKERSEDAAVAFSWFQYINNQSHPEWILYWPMTKAVVRAMDTMTEYTAQRFGYKMDKFMIAGASKRGWITWLTGAVDSRVEGIIPMVCDLLNFEPALAHMFQAYGGWTFAFKDYWEMNLTTLFGTPQMAALAKMIDPLEYKDTLDIPKLVLNAAGDEFFMLDNDHYWWGELPGETKRLMVSNAEHSLATGIDQVLIGADGFYKSLLMNATRPSFEWTMDPTDGGKITLTTTQKPELVMLKFASTWGDVRRDFRLIKGDTKTDPCHFIEVDIFGKACVNPVIWWGESIAPSSTSTNEHGETVYTYVATQPLPVNGWRAFFLELNYPLAGALGYKFTTQVSIIPNTFPFAKCQGAEQCKGNLV
eukprot:TRINITY_DN64410_c0_g1_i2.p1 TRINITY_DN64410_c0_g1~~TRINITY_DN64410_c0_g1_i2.p1  ORF type:complete len:539 (-),score=306.55 TRINITY_DN64410_c0_g1_i2:238-1854(-)